MSKFFYNPTVVIDVSADFSMVVILAPNGDAYALYIVSIRHTKTLPLTSFIKTL
ncbi:hypothetical protein [Clostridium botulinum]|uniref:hypothetical protein n=1 Tax=Clostridium botulinum TaxID=1491 RepID=UPI000A5BBC1F|nr:hypothetical protein [Clostridium botulinum]